MSNSSISQNENGTHQIAIRTGLILRNLRNSMQQLGLDKSMAELAMDVPQARQRLGHIVTLTREAADSVMNSVEMAQPGQDKLAAGAGLLKLRWDAWSVLPSAEKQAHDLASNTLSWLTTVPHITQETSQHLHAIMMAQGFEDITGQIVQHMVGVLNQVEKQLIQLLRDSTASSDHFRSTAQSHSVSAEDKPSSQDDVDELLSSLGL